MRKQKNVPVVLITGSPGSGKSTLMARLIDDVGRQGIAGLSTPEVRRGRVRVGFRMIDLATGQEELLASTSAEGPLVGKYHVNVEAIDHMVGTIESSLASARFIFVDEIGRMELLSDRFKEFVDRVFSLNKPVIAVIHRSVVPEYRDKGRLFTLTRKNFDDIHASIFAILQLAP